MKGKNEMRARVLSAIMTGTMVVSLCPSAAFAVSGDAVAKDGTYQKTVTVVNDSEDEDDWENYDLNISLTVTEGKISAITAEPGDNYDPSNQGYVDKAVSKTKGIATLLNGADATENSVIDWDVVSGATCTSNAVKSAVLAMIQEAEEAGLEENTGSGEEPGTGEEVGEGADTGKNQQETSGSITIAGVDYNWISEEKEGYTQIADSGIYYAVAEGNTALTGTLYGTASLSFTDFYAGDTSRENYDTISSATTSKYTLFANEDISEVTEDGYEIYGVKNVNVAVDAKTYVEAQILSAANKLPSTGVYTKAATITLNEEAKEEASQYKTLQADGTYSATKANIAATVTDATASLNTSSNWGDYEIDLKETTTSYIRNSRDDAAFEVNSQIQGLILETTDGTKVGMRYLDEIWVQPYEVAFSKDSELVGKTVNKITFVMPNATYVYELADGVYVKEQLKENMKVTATFEDENTVKVTGLKDFTNPKVSVYYVEGSGRNKVTTYYAQDVEAKDGVVSLEQAATEGLTYTVKVTSDDYVDTTVSAEFSAAEAGDANVNSITIAGVNYNWISEEKEGYTQIADSGIYYAVAEGNTALTGTLYGTASLSFTDFYAGDTSRENYDTISSATTSKYTLFANEDISEVTEDGYEIYGVKNVNVAVDAKTYVEAQILSAANKLPSTGVYTKAATITLNEEAKEEASQYKTLQADGTYSATKANIAATVTDATASLNTSSNWGDYEIDLKETTTSYIRNSRDDAAFEVNSQIQGLILETTDGTKVGMRYLDEIWVQPYEVAFSKDSELVGKTVNKITFVMPNATYVYELADGVYVKEQLKENMKVTATFEDENTVKVTGLKDFTNPKVSVYYVEGSGRNKVTTYYAQDVEAKDGVVSLEQAATEGLTYTVKVTSDDYVDTTVSVEFSAAEAGDNSGSDSGNEESSDSNSDTTSEDESSSENNTDSNAGENSGTSDTSSGTTDTEPTATTETTSTTEPAATTATTSTASTTAVTTQENTYQSAEGYAMRSLEQNTVKIDGLASLLPEGTQISVSQLTSETDLARAKTAMNGVLQENCDYVVYEIDLSNSSGTEIHELAGYVSVTMAIPSGLVVGNGNTIVVYRLNDDGTLTKCTTTVKDGKVTFLTNHFSTFIFSEEPLEETTVKTGDETGKQIYMICLLLLLGMGILYLGNKRKSLKL
ncbi:MAG: FMN-binding protein [Roseburia sp.]